MMQEEKSNISVEASRYSLYRENVCNGLYISYNCLHLIEMAIFERSAL